MSDVRKDGALCNVCKGRMLKIDGCRMIQVSIYDGPPPQRGERRRPVKVMDPIPFGKEERYGQVDPPIGRCHDCGAMPGKFHHPGCDWEECPNCHLQMISCGGECG